MSVKVLIVDDHPLFRAGVGVGLRALDEDIRIVFASDAEQGIATALEQPDFDLVLLDLVLPGMNGLVAIREFRLHCPLLPVVVLSGLENAVNARRALSAGAAGFIPKSLPAEDVVNALRRVIAGDVYVPPSMCAPVTPDCSSHPSEVSHPAVDAGLLTVRQIEILACMGRGKGNKEIAAGFGISEKTVKTHVSAIFKVLRVVNRTQAVLVAQRMGLVPAL